MPRSIDDWYANAWATEQDPAHDWENDDPFDHSVDSWLDDLPAQPIDNGHGARTPAPRQRATTTSRPRRSIGIPQRARPGNAPGEEHDAYRTREVDAAIQRIRTATPGIGARKLARRLRDRGWPAITGREVRARLEHLP